MKKKHIFMLTACTSLLASSCFAITDSRVQYSASDAQSLTHEGSSNKISITYSHGERKGKTLTAKDPYIPYTSETGNIETASDSTVLPSVSSLLENYSGDVGFNKLNEIGTLSSEAIIEAYNNLNEARRFDCYGNEGLPYTGCLYFDTPYGPASMDGNGNLFVGGSDTGCNINESCVGDVLNIDPYNEDDMRHISEQINDVYGLSTDVTDGPDGYTLISKGPEGYNLLGVNEYGQDVLGDINYDENGNRRIIGPDPSHEETSINEFGVDNTYGSAPVQVPYADLSIKEGMTVEGLDLNDPRGAYIFSQLYPVLLADGIIDETTPIGERDITIEKDLGITLPDGTKISDGLTLPVGTGVSVTGYQDKITKKYLTPAGMVTITAYGKPQISINTYNHQHVGGGN